MDSKIRIGRKLFGAFFIRVLLVAGCLLASAGTAVPQPITFPGSMSIGEDDLTVRVQPAYVRTASDPSGRGRKLIDRRTRLFGMYGLTEKTTLFSRIDHLERRFDDGTTTHTDRGIGDLEVFLRHTVYERNWPGRTFSVSPYAGIELPTGGDTSPGFPRERTLGSGSVDYFAGFAVRDAAWGEAHRFLSVRYTANTESDGFERGDVVELDAAVKPPLASWEAGGEVVGLNGILEVNLHWQDRHTLGGRTVPESGGTRLDLTPGLIYTTHRWILEAAVRVPVVQNRHGGALENDYGVLAGVWRNF